MPPFQNHHAVVIGINTYRNGIAPLKTAVNDAQALADLLQREHQYQTQLLLDRTATLSHLMELLQRLSLTIGADDRLLFYFAGHGIALEGDDGPAGYLVPQDAQLENPATFLRMQELHDALTALPCRHLLAVFDCCFAGAFRWSSTRKLIPIPEVIHKERYDRFIQDPAWQVITSAASNQLAWDVLSRDDRGQVGLHSPFADALLQALQGAADAFPPVQNGKPPGDGVITATELYLYLRDAIELNSQTPNQTPGLWTLKNHDKGEFIFLSPGHELNLPPAPPLDAANNPYQGLASFEETDRSLFFGRDALIASLAEFVIHNPLTIVLGASGSGKSSLVKAGLIPHLKELSNQDNSSYWQILPLLRPEASPLQSLSRSLISFTENHNGKSFESLTNWIADWRKTDQHTQLLLVIDQFEELITLCENDAERDQFLQQLSDALQTQTDRLHLVVTLRSDFEPQFRNSALEPDWSKARFIVPAMSRDELRQAIEAPASERVMYFEPHGLVDRLVDEVIQMPGALPLLSFTLSELYLKYLQRQTVAQQQGEILERAITQADYDELGGVTRSLTQRADQEYAALVNQDAACGQTVEQVMLRMVSVGSGELARRRVPLAELDYPEPEQQRVNQVIDRFSQARLLVSNTDANGQPYVEPAHDALVRGWQRLLDWVNTAQEILPLQRRLTPAANEWQQQQRASYLWNADPRLTLLNQILRSPGNWLNRSEAEFVRRSVRQRRQNTILRSVLIPGGLVALLIAGLVARSRGELVDLQLRAFRAENLLATDSANGLVAAIQAAGQNLNRLPNNVVESVADNLLTAIEKARESNRFTADEQGSVESIAVSGDGQTIVSGGNDGKLHLWTPRGEAVTTFQPTKQIQAVAISNNGQTIVSLDRDHGVYFWNRSGRLITQPFRSNLGQIQAVAVSANGQTILSGDDVGKLLFWNRQGQIINAPIARHNAAITAVAISQDSQTIVTTDVQGFVQLWNAEGQPIGSLFKAHEKPILAVAISQDGKRIVTGSKDRTLRLWNRQAEPIGQSFRGHAEPINSVAIRVDRGNADDSDNVLIISGSDDETIRRWDGAGNPIGQPLRALVQSVNAVAMSPDGQTILSGCGDGTIGFWDIQPNPVNLALNANQGSVNAVATSADGKMIASGGNDGTVRFWDQTGKAIGQASGHQDFIWSVAISPNFSSNQGTIAVGDDIGLLYLWNSQGQLIVPPIQAHSAAIRSIAISPDQVIFSGSEDGTVRAWNPQGDWAAPPINTGDLVWAVAISPDGNQLATGGRTAAKLWNRQGQLVATFATQTQGVRSISFSPNGQQIATGSGDGNVRLWDQQGNLINSFIGHQATVLSVAFSADGRWLASGSADRTLRVWDTEADTTHLAFRTHTDKVYAVTFLPNRARPEIEQTLISGSRDGTIQFLQERQWSQWLQVACHRLQYHQRLWQGMQSNLPSAWQDIEQEAKDTCQPFWQNP